MTKSDTSSSQSPTTEAGRPAVPELPPGVCALCDADVLQYSTPLLRLRLEQVLPMLDERGTFDLARVLERPTDVSGDVLICTSCSMTPLWVASKRLFARHRMDAEAAAAKPAAGGKA